MPVTTKVVLGKVISLETATVLLCPTFKSLMSEIFTCFIGIIDSLRCLAINTFCYFNYGSDKTDMIDMWLESRGVERNPHEISTAFKARMHKAVWKHGELDSLLAACKSHLLHTEYSSWVHRISLLLTLLLLLLILAFVVFGCFSFPYHP